MLLIARGRALNLAVRWYLATVVAGVATAVLVRAHRVDQLGWGSATFFGFVACLSGVVSVGETVVLRARGEQLELSTLLKRASFPRAECRIFSRRFGSLETGGRYTVCVTDDETRRDVGSWLWSRGAERAARRLKQAFEIP
jgi:hypothetical protein